MFTIASLDVSSGQQAVAQHEHSPALLSDESHHSVGVAGKLGFPVLSLGSTLRPCDCFSLKQCDCS
jgi:hypothetical protein